MEDAHDDRTQADGSNRDAAVAPDLAVLASRADAPASIHAAYILIMHNHLMIKNDARPGQEVVRTAWASWTAACFEDFATMAADVPTGRNAEAYLRRDLRAFLDRAGNEPVPAHWHPDHPEFEGGSGPAWKRLCDHAARLVNGVARYGVPAVAPEVVIPPLPRIPNLGFADKFLPAPLKVFLKDYAETLTRMPEGTFSSAEWSKWTAEAAEAGDGTVSDDSPE